MPTEVHEVPIQLTRPAEFYRKVSEKPKLNLRSFFGTLTPCGVLLGA
jgi:hypothetical protein